MPFRGEVFLLANSFLSKLCWGKGIAAHTKSQQWKKEESEWLRGEGDKIKLIDLSFEKGQVGGSGKARRKKDVP